MRNLKLDKRVVYPKDLNGQIFCVGDNSSVFCCDNNSNRLLRILYSDHQFTEPEELACSDLLQDVFYMQFLVSTGALFIATKSGSFLQYYMHNEVLELFQSAQGVSTFAVSPDSRLSVIITEESTLLLMSIPDLEVIMQLDLTSEGIDSSKEGTFSVGWLHDSTYFAVNYNDTKSGFRKIKFYDDTGVLYSTTEDCNPLQYNIISWQPSGGLIASIGRPTMVKDRIMVSLFELNGLKRADFFTLEGTGKNSVSEILWNSASDILALNMGDRLELWTRNNYQWMLKLRLQDYIESEESDISKSISWVGWDPELPNRLHMVYEGRKYVVYDLTFGYTLGNSGGSAISASINGDTVYCTPFRDNCAPPPECFFQTKLPALPVEVIVSSFWDGLLCILSNETLAYYKNSKSHLELVKVCKIPEWKECRSAYSWAWANMSTLCCSDGESLTLFRLVSHNIITESSVSAEKVFEDIVIETRSPMKCASIRNLSELSEESDYILVQEIDGQIKLLNVKTLESNLMCKFPQVCSDIKYVFNKCSENKYQNIIVFGHDPLTRKLYAGWMKSCNDSSKLSGECTSMSTYQNNLLFTTVKGSLEIISSQDIEKILSSNSAIIGLLSSPEGQYSRKSEKGSIIASCCLNQMYEPSLVLQIIPRGNLETIYPRPLVISSINLLLRNKSLRNFTKIMAAMRRHRIDYNILIDELKKIETEDKAMPLVASLQEMVEQVKDSHSLVLLVTEMNQNNLDCLKIIKIVLEEYMSKTDGGKVDEPYLAVMAKLGLFEEVLRSQLITGDESLRDVTKHRIKFLSFYCDNPEILYESALGTYDLNLAAIVADCLNKDPKEYIPILNEYRAMSAHKMYYTIDNSLRRYGAAVKSLINDGSVQIDEILRYISRHRLFPEVLHYLSSIEKTKENRSNLEGRNLEAILELTKETQNAYGLYLKNHGKLREASIFYARSENYEDAIECCMKSGNWEYALELARKDCRSSQDDFKNWCRKLVDCLEERKDFEGAAHISEVYLQEMEEAVKYLISAQKWTLASSLCLKDSVINQSKIDELVKPKLMDAYLSMDENIQATLKDIVKYEKRLEAVKIAKENKKDEDENDTFSDTDSISTGSGSIGSFRTFSSSNSGKTHRSNKNKRKQERKVFSLKEGSPFEDLAITVHLWEMFNQINLKLKSEVSLLVEALWRFQMDEYAIPMAMSFENLLSEVDKAIKVIWATLLPENHLLDSKFQLPPPGWSTVWDKLSFGYSSVTVSGTS